MTADIRKAPFYVRLTIVAAGLVFITLIMRGASSLLIPLFAGLLLAILFLPLANFMETRGFRRSTAALVSVLCFVFVFLGINYFLTAQISSFLSDLPGINAKLQSIFSGLQAWFAEKFHIDKAHQTDYLSSSLKDIVSGITGFASLLLLSLGNILIWILFVCVYAYFILYYRRLLYRFVIKLFEHDCPDEIRNIIGGNKLVIKSYISGLLIEFLIVLALSVTSLVLLGNKYALMLGIIVALLNIIPYIGIYTAILLVMFVTYANSTGASAIQAGIALLVIHFIDGLFLLPRVVGSRMKMNPFITIIAVILGDVVWGIPGMFLFIPLAAMLRIIFENISSLEAWAILFDEEPKKLEEKNHRQKVNRQKKVID